MYVKQQRQYFIFENLSIYVPTNESLKFVCLLLLKKKYIISYTYTPDYARSNINILRFSDPIFTNAPCSLEVIISS